MNRNYEENKPNYEGNAREEKTEKNPEQLFKLILRELPDREFTIKVAEHSLPPVISILSKHFNIEIE